MSGGWLQLHRQIIDSQVFANAELLKLWLWCLCRASYKTQHVPMRTGRGETIVTLDAGQFVFGRHEAAKALRMKPATVSYRLQKLEKLGNLSIQASSHYSVVTICNWRSYQLAENEGCQPSEQATSNELASNSQATSTYNKDNKENKGKKKKKRASKPPAFIPDLSAIDWPKHLNTTPARRALQAWADYKQAQPHRWKTQAGPQALVNSFNDYAADQFVTQINLALAHGTCKAPWLPANTFGKSSQQTRGGAVRTDPSVQRELQRAGKIKAAREQIKETKDEATRISLEATLGRLLEEPERATR